jgi:predicted Zn-ribbon and HTH transcriptional regulator
MAFKSQYNMSQDAFDDLLMVIGSLLPEDHVLPKSIYEAQKLLRALKMMYEQIHACSKGCVLFRKEYTEAKYCPKCKSSRFMEVDSGDGQKRQLDIPVTILRHLPFIPRIQRLYMTEESAK